MVNGMGTRIRAAFSLWMGEFGEGRVRGRTWEADKVGAALHEPAWSLEKLEGEWKPGESLAKTQGACRGNGETEAKSEWGSEERNIRRNQPLASTRCWHNSRLLKWSRGYDDICSSLVPP